jgi:argininosuccinate lyase
MKLWDKGKSLNQLVEDYTVGGDYILDNELVKYDCQASIAHAKMLEKIGVLTEKEASKLEEELTKIISLHTKGKFEIKKEHEDCHTAIEIYLTKKLGELGKKIHTARSRNDQVLTALRLYYKNELGICMDLIKKLISVQIEFIDKYGSIPLPGYTHMRKAMPSSIELWTGAYIDSMHDNLQQIDSVQNLIDQSPLGTAAGYGLPLEVDRGFTAVELGFANVQSNPIYTQNSRGKFEGVVLSAINQVMYDLNKLAADLIIFSMGEFGYFKLPDELTTGSSIMPQKKNPDVLELLRGNYSVTLSMEFQVKQLISNLMSGYNRDIQLTKEPVIKSFRIVEQSLQITSLLFSELIVNEENCRKAMSDDLYATEEVYKLVKEGYSFREAYKIIAKKFN